MLYILFLSLGNLCKENASHQRLKHEGSLGVVETGVLGMAFLPGPVLSPPPQQQGRSPLLKSRVGLPPVPMC